MRLLPKKQDDNNNNKTKKAADAEAGRGAAGVLMFIGYNVASLFQQ